VSGDLVLPCSEQSGASGEEEYAINQASARWMNEWQVVGGLFKRLDVRIVSEGRLSVKNRDYLKA
jgi:hypothetical protein